MKTKKSTIIKEMWDKAPKAVKKYARREGAIIVSMAAGLQAAGHVDECGKTAVQDMAHELNYTWNPFDGFCA